MLLIDHVYTKIHFNDLAEHPDYAQMTGLPLLSETHGGDDVPIYSKGPFAHLLTGVQHQSFIPHAIAFAACLVPPVDNYVTPLHCQQRNYDTTSRSPRF